MVTWQALRADNLLKIISKVVLEDFDDKHLQKIILNAFAVFFHEFFFDYGGYYQPPDAINR